MTTYYISPSGSNANNGLGPDASAGTNKPWLTVGKAMNTGSAVLPGDTVYIAPGYFYSEALIPIASISSAGSPTSFIGDPTNAQGFKDGSGVPLAPGIPWVTTRTAGEGPDAIAASPNNLIRFDSNGPAGLSFSKLYLESASSPIGLIDTSKGGTIKFTDCACVSNGSTVFNCSAGTPTANYGLTVDRCFLVGTAVIYVSTATNAATADANLDILVKNSLIIGPLSASFSVGNGGNTAGGVSFQGNTIICYWPYLSTVAARCSTVNPIHFGHNLFIYSSGVSAGTSGAIIDDGYNRATLGGGSFTNVTKAGTTILGSAANLVLPHLVKWGLEMPRSDFLGWTDAAHANQKFSASGDTTADYRARTVRPWGAGASIGCWQAQDVTQDTSSAITGGGTNSLKLTGAGEVSLYIPVGATGFTVSVTTKSTSYGGSNYPQICVCANPSVGVTSDTTATASSASEQTITTSTITPTSNGVMEVRLISRSTSTSSTTHFDLLTST